MYVPLTHSPVVQLNLAQSNDLIGHLHDILQYNEVVKYLKSVVDDDKDGETVLIGTADHECGGLALVCPNHPDPDCI